MRRIANNGFTLLEVLIALLILSLGLMGVAGLLVVSVQTNHSAYLRTQAAFLAQSIADRMRANVLGVWNNSYIGTFTSATGGSASGCVATYCSYAQVAARDLLIWSNQLGEFLPNPTATIACAPPPAPLPTPDQLVERPPYSNSCTVTLVWGEMATQTGAASTPETLAWVFQP